MKSLLLASVLSFSYLSSLSYAQAPSSQRSITYPFDVTIGGQKAKVIDGNILFAVIENPVKADALLEIDKVAPMLIINAFACKENGAVMEAGAQPAVIFTQNTKSTKLTATMDKKPLAPGRYLANVVAHNTTSRVVFVVEDKSGTAKIPSLKQLIDFLQK